ncbi:MAG: hypothetical protein ABJA70_21700 [Chryseolinea sp.]
MNISATIFTNVCVFLILSGCGSSEVKKMHQAFDSSLDTLIKGTTSYVPTVAVYDDDTLKASPKKVEDSFYYRVQQGGVWVLSEKISITFRDHNLVRLALETYDHNKTIVNHLYYEKNIDDDDLISKRRQYGPGDSSLYGSARWYDKKGNNVKAVQAISAEMRTLKVYKYDSLNRVSELWQRTLFTKNISDSAYNNRVVKTEYLYRDGFNKAASRRYSNKTLLDSTAASNDNLEIDWHYEYDKNGNWIRREAPDGLHYVERKIVY